MKITKMGQTVNVGSEPNLELEAINAFSKTPLSLEDIYTFSVLLCDNDVDRDYERFSEQTLMELSELFRGKTGILDHEWKTDHQFARIYRTELVREQNRKNALGEPYVYLKGYAYMLRTESNAELIAEIEGGIKKETSVGCSVSRSICSICGEEVQSSACSHLQGKEYNGKLCFAELTGAVDAYEWSFVAVPAQKNSGVLKRYGGQGTEKTLRAFIKSPAGNLFLKEFQQLSKEAEAGRQFASQLKNEVLRLALLCDKSMHQALKHTVKHMDTQELISLQKALEGQLTDRFPPVSQLPGRDAVTKFEDTEYLI